MKQLVHGSKVVAWVESKVGYRTKPDRQGIGLLDGGEIVAGVVFDQRWAHDVTISMAAQPGSMTRQFVVGACKFAFVTLGVRRITAGVRRSNKASMLAAKRVGFKFEGVQRGGYLDGEDRVMFGLLKEDCRWLDSK